MVSALSAGLDAPSWGQPWLLRLPQERQNAPRKEPQNRSIFASLLGWFLSRFWDSFWESFWSLWAAWAGHGRAMGGPRSDHCPNRLGTKWVWVLPLSFRPLLEAFGTILCDLGGILGVSWAILGLFWGYVWRSWRLLGPSWGSLGVFLGDLGAILGRIGLSVLSFLFLWPGGMREAIE